MAQMIEILAREMVVELETEPDKWTEIEAVRTITPTPSKTNADTGHFQAAGWDRHIVAARGLSFSLEIVYQEDEDTGARPEGQAALDELSRKVGYQSLGTFRVYGPNGKGIKFRASVDVPPIAGGGLNDAGTYTATLDMSDAPEAITVTPGP